MNARELFEAGWRAHNWGAILTDTDEETVVSSPNGEEMTFADGISRRTERAEEWIRPLIGDAEPDDVLSELSRLTDVAENGPVFVNLTTHAINVHDWITGEIRTIQPSGNVARVAATCRVVATINGIDIVKTVFGDIKDLPGQQPGVIYITSSMVAQAVRGRDDVVAPDTGPSAIRNEDGQIVAVRRLQQF